MVRHVLLALDVLLALAIMVATSHGVAAQQQPGATLSAATPGVTQPDQNLLKPEQLEALVAPIALYPDALLANMLAAATYPLEVVEADRWVKENKLKGDALAADVSKKSWDDSVKALTATPSVLDTMSGKLDWTKSLGDAMLAQQADVMDAIQRLREKAKANNKLSSNKQQKVTVLQQDGGQAIVIEPTDPNTMYVPYYEPATVYGGWPYADYPPYYFGYPSYIGAGVIATGIAFGTAYAVGRWGNYWGGRFNWGNRNVYVNHRTNNVWQHNPVHREGVRYNNANVQQRFGNNNLRASANNRMDFRGKGGQQVLNPTANRSASLGDRAGSAGDRAGVGDRAGNAGDRAGDRARDGAGNRGDRTANRGNTGGANRINAADVRGNRGNAGSRAGQGGGPQRAAAANRAGANPARANSARGGGLNVSPARAANAASSRGRASFASVGGGGGPRAGGGGGFRGGGGRRSDLALKHDIVLLGHLDNGLGYYRFSYNGSNKAYVGVIAQDVQTLRPDAVTRGRDGYLRVYYEKLGLKFQSYQEWLASGAHIPAGLGR